jgi:hypothetical protein
MWGAAGCACYGRFRLDSRDRGSVVAQLLTVQSTHLPRHSREVFGKGRPTAFKTRSGLAVSDVIERRTGLPSPVVEPPREVDGR